MKTTITLPSLFFPLGLIAAAVALNGCDTSDGYKGTSSGTISSGQNTDSVIEEFPIAYIQRPIPFGLADDNAVRETLLPDNVLEPESTFYGAKLMVKDRASIVIEARNITELAYPPITPEATEENPNPEPVEQLYDVRDLSPNFAGTRLAFSMRAPEDPSLPEEEQAPWHIWEYDFTTGELTQITYGSALINGHSRFPTYLPDDSIVFSSTRQRESKAMLGNQSRPQYSYVTEADDEVRAFTLHVFDEEDRDDPERADIQQISFGKGHDIYPTVLDDGRILFLRGDATSTRNRDRLSLYTMNPDGSNVEPYYGYHSPSGMDIDGQGGLIRPIEMPDGRILVTYRERETSLMGGDIVAIDGANFIDLTTPTFSNANDPNEAEESVSVGEVTVEDQSPHGVFNSAYPLFDGTNRLITSWMPCSVKGYRLGIYVNDDRILTILNDDDEVIAEIPQYHLMNIDGEYVDRSGNVLDVPINEEDGLVTVNALGEVVIVEDRDQPVEIDFDEIVALPCTGETTGVAHLSPSDPKFGIWVYDLDASRESGTPEVSPVEIANDPGVVYTEAVALVPRTNPTTYLGLGLDDPEFTAELLDGNVGVINIRSIYDIDGTDVSANGISAMGDPLQTPPDTLPVRFVRFVEQANMPHEDDYNIDDDLVEGRGNQTGKSIIGYAQVFPDGSVMAKVPANVPFSLELVDANGKRVGGTLGNPHRNWINVRPGEVRECNGCHTPNSLAPHGRSDAQAPSAYAGNLNGLDFPNTDLTDIDENTLPEVGETMAEYYVRAKRELPAVDNVKFDPLIPSINLLYTDEWTDPDSGATPGTAINIDYGDPAALGPDDLLTTAPVPFGGCLNTWNANCRIVINYEDHIQPIFEVERIQNDADHTCTNCHAAADSDGVPQVPAPGSAQFQLDFTSQDSMLDPMLYLKGYDELFAAGDPIQALNENNVLVQAVTERRDENGNIVYDTEPQVNDNGEQLYEVVGGGVCEPLSNMDVVFEVDADGNNIRCFQLRYYQDNDGNPTDAEGNLLAPGEPLVFIPVFDNLFQLRYLNPNSGATSNQRFFNVFEVPGTTTAPDHAGFLTPAELKLFAEWLDGGSQYYNEIFRAVDD